MDSSFVLRVLLCQSRQGCTQHPGDPYGYKSWVPDLASRRTRVNASGNLEHHCCSVVGSR
eukprot:1304027-Pyramimonas_sp.AAC.1